MRGDQKAKQKPYLGTAFFFSLFSWTPPYGACENTYLCCIAIFTVLAYSYRFLSLPVCQCFVQMSQIHCLDFWHSFACLLTGKRAWCLNYSTWFLGPSTKKLIVNQNIKCPPPMNSEDEGIKSIKMSIRHFLITHFDIRRLNGNLIFSLFKKKIFKIVFASRNCCMK